MEQKQNDHIIKNLNKLVSCTKNKRAWYDQLLEHNFLNGNTLKEISNSTNTLHSRIRKAYLECLKTTEFELLIQTLKKSQNDTAANILEEFFATSLPTSSKSKNKLVWFGMQPLTKHYKGREEELQAIHDSWLESCIDDKPGFVCITGLGGLGKSELARKYAYNFFTKIHGHCVWVNAENESTFMNAFQRLAEKIGISLQDCRGKEKTWESLIFGILKFFSMKNYLIVFDNLDTYEEKFFKCFLDHTKKLSQMQTKPFVILTSRCQLGNKDFPFRVKPLQLSVLPVTSSVSYFKDALNISDENAEALSNLTILCLELDHLPLAMQQAAAYINEMKQNSYVSTEINEYLKIFKRESKALLEYRVPKYQNRDSFSKPTYLTWQITLDKFKGNLKFYSVVTLALNVISFFQSGNIPVRLLKSIIRLAATESTDIELTFYEGGPDAFETLVSYSMCEISKFENEVYLSVHRLVQTVTQIKLKEEQKWNETWNMLIKIINDIYKDNVNATSNEIYHIVNLLRYVEESTTIILEPKIFYDLLVKVQEMYIAAGLYQQGKIFGEFAIRQAERRFGNEARQTLLVMSTHGRTLLHCGSLTKAELLLDRVYLKQVHRVNESASRDKIEEYDCLGTKRVLAAVLEQKGNYDEALQMYLQILKVEHGVHEIEHHPELISNNSSKSQQWISNYNEAVENGLKLLEIWKRFYGIDHPSTENLKKHLDTLHNLIGNFDRAYKKYLEILKVGEHVLGVDHPCTITIKKQLELIHQNLRNDKLRKKYLNLVEDMKRIIIIDNSRTLITRKNIALAYQNKGHYDKALNMLLEILEAGEHILGFDHPDTLDTKYNIAMTYHRKGNDGEALKWYLEVQETSERVFEIDHPSRLSIMNNIALAYHGKGNYDYALRIFLDVLESQEIVLGIDHPYVTTTKMNIGMTLVSKGNYDDALKMFLEVLEVLDEIHGIDHPKTLVTKNNIAFILQRKEDYDEALKMFSDVLKVGKKVLGVDHPDMLATRNNIASTYGAKGNYDDALIMYMEILETSERVLGAEHPSTLTTKCNIAMIHYKKNNYNVALKLLLELHKVWVRVLGSDHPRTLTALFYIGLTYHCMGKLEKALIIYLAFYYQAKIRVLRNSGT